MASMERVDSKALKNLAMYSDSDDEDHEGHISRKQRRMTNENNPTQFEIGPKVRFSKRLCYCLFYVSGLFHL